MILLWLTFLLLSGSKCIEQDELNQMAKVIEPFRFSTYMPQATPLDELKHAAVFGDAEQRGPSWYDFNSDGSSVNSDLDSKITDTSGSISSELTPPDSFSNSASSVETDASKKAQRTYRTCTSCPYDMLKKHKNIGIKWICGGYQRARRSFKSLCMMRYRNCEDGTMFTKISDYRCKNDSYHGRHWFYVYRV